jgi:hypothetical protein
MPQCQFPVFCLFCVSEKLHRKYSWNWTKQKPDVQIFTKASRELNRRRRGATGGPHHQGARPRAGPRPPIMSPTRTTSDDAPLPIKTPRWEKPKDPITFLEYIAIRCRCRPEDQEGPEALPDTLSERGITIGDLLHRHACLRRNDWVVYLGLWFHSSS